jgi:hypothetical protein
LALAAPSLNAILGQACEMSDSAGGAIYVLNEENDELIVAASRNATEEHLAGVREHAIRRGDGECVDRREAVQVADIVCLSLKGCTLVLQSTMTPIERPSLTIGTPSTVR